MGMPEIVSVQQVVERFLPEMPGAAERRLVCSPIQPVNQQTCPVFVRNITCSFETILMSVKVFARVCSYTSGLIVCAGQTDYCSIKQKSS